jgi:predicted RNA binding protein YcfA (HicA-like mRNA interferase family)
MKALSGRDFARLVERRSWTLLRVKGSHHIYGKSGSVVRPTIPIQGNRPASRHLAKLSEIEDEGLN